jgi:hypothetical protein
MQLARLAAAVLFAASTVASAGCAEETLTREFARIKLTPLPEGLQTARADPVGMDLGTVPLHGLGTARFRIDNLGPVPLKISSAEVEASTGGVFTVDSVSDEVQAYNLEEDAGRLVISFSPAADGVVGEATIAVHTNGGESQKEVARVQLRGLGLFVGSPNLEVCYGGQCYPQVGQCADRGDGRNVCRLSTLDFGNVPLNSTATQELRLRNVPLPDTCEPPPGSPECTPVCRLVFDRDAGGRNLGFGFDPGGAGFELVGNIALPFHLDVPNPQCGFVSEVRLLVDFRAGASETNAATTLVIENNDPDATFIEVPLTAAARLAPVAVAQIRTCDLGPPEACTPNPDTIAPLDTVYLTGENSYDLNAPPQPISAWEWQMIEWPPGANPADFELTGITSPFLSLWLPLAGRYVARLKVTNQDDGVSSGVSPTSDVEIFAVPDSRVHVELIWDHPNNDMDLHLTNADVSDLVCKAPDDCFWDDCLLLCLDPEADCRLPLPQWFGGFPVYEGGNPRLDIDDTNGLGPENAVIDAPEPGRYRVYVHYYTVVDRATDPTYVTVRIYVDAILRAEFRRVLHPDDLWRIAEIQWYADNSSEVVPATSDGLGVGAVRTMYNCSNPFAFGEVL